MPPAPMCSIYCDELFFTQTVKDKMNYFTSIALFVFYSVILLPLHSAVDECCSYSDATPFLPNTKLGTVNFGKIYVFTHKDRRYFAQ